MRTLSREVQYAVCELDQEFPCRLLNLLLLLLVALPEVVLFPL